MDCTRKYPARRSVVVGEDPRSPRFNRFPDHNELSPDDLRELAVFFRDPRRSRCPDVLSRQRIPRSTRNELTPSRSHEEIGIPESSPTGLTGVGSAGDYQLIAFDGDSSSENSDSSKLPVVNKTVLPVIEFRAIESWFRFIRQINLRMRKLCQRSLIILGLTLICLGILGLIFGKKIVIIMRHYWSSTFQSCGLVCVLKIDFLFLYSV